MECYCDLDLVILVFILLALGIFLGYVSRWLSED